MSLHYCEKVYSYDALLDCVLSGYYYLLLLLERKD